MPEAKPSPEHVVMLVHGIRTEAAWAEMVVDVLQKREGLMAIPIRYGYFTIQRMVVPFLRRPPVERLLREIHDLRERYPNAKISVIAHSFGAYTVSQALFESGFRIQRLVLCGSVIRRSYRWDQVGHRLEDRVVNECGTHDIWPVLSGAITFGLGASGTFGFGTLLVRDRFHKFSHSDYFDRNFVERFWAPYIWDGEIVGSDWEKTRPVPPWWQSALALLPIKWLPLVALVIGAILFLFHFTRSVPSPPVIQENPLSEQPNLLQNPGFEDEIKGFGVPAGWRPRKWAESTDSILNLSTESPKNGQRTAYLRSGIANHIRFSQTVDVAPNTWYLLTGWIRTRNVLHSSDPIDRGAHLAIVGVAEDKNPYPEYSAPVFGDSVWVHCEVNFDSKGFNKADVFVELGGYSAITSGEAWFDELVLVKVGKS